MDRLHSKDKNEAALAATEEAPYLPPEYTQYRVVKRWAGNNPVQFVAGGFLDQPALYMQQYLICQLAEQDVETARRNLAVLNAQAEAAYASKHQGLT